MIRIERPEFTVDTGLFRQLGELLVGRDSTALVELIKNAYDADATHVLLRGEHLDSPERALLTVADNGTGMTEAQFRSGFLRLAARSKTQGGRRSPIYQRRFTGEKGVGRLAAHKLAALVDVTTIASVDEGQLPFAARLRVEQPELAAHDLIELLRRAPRTLTMAQIDWDLIESAETLSSVREGLILESGEVGSTTVTGTTLTLLRLRHAWTLSDLRDLVRQLNNFEPPYSLTTKIQRAVIPQSLLFDEPIVRDADRLDPGITLDFEGDFANPEEYWSNVFRTAEWILEIRAIRGSGVISYALTPTKVNQESNPFSQPLRASMPHPKPDQGPFFDARILLRSGHVPTTEASWTELNSGIRVYLEGFRVLPYGEPRNDWLSLDFDYTKRAGRFHIDPLLGGAGDDLTSLRNLADRDVSLRLLPNRAFFGAVFLTDEGAGGLRTLVNREGFVPDEVYDRLVEMVSIGVRLLQRARALASYSLKKHEQKLKEAAKVAEQAALDAAKAAESNATQGPDDGISESDNDIPDYEDGNSDDSADGDLGEDNHERVVLGNDGASQGSAARLQAALADLWRVLEQLRDRVQSSDGSALLPVALLPELLEKAHAVDEAANLLIEDTSLLRVLASVGSQLASFTHELSQLIPSAIGAERSLASTAGTRWPKEVTHARRAITDLRRGLERQASYLVDVASTEGRRRRSRQNLRERVDAAFLGFQGTAAARDVELVNSVTDDTRTPPLFRAELQAVLTNLLSNAIKAADTGGRVEVAGDSTEQGLSLIVQNTGVRVRPEEGEKWFVPYASTTTGVDLVLGQGMGLGLPITRDLIAEYGGSVRFVKPTSGYATAIQVLVPE